MPVIGQMSVGQPPLTYGSDVSVNPPAQIVQSQTINIPGTASSTTWTLTPVTIKTGNAMLIFYQVYSTVAQQTSSVSDGVNTWAQVFAVNPGGGNAQMFCSQTTNASPSLAGGTITITFNNNAAVGVAQFLEVSGSAPSGGVVAAHANATAAGTTAFSTPNLNFTVAPALAIAACGLDINANRTDTMSNALFTQQASQPTSAYPSLTGFTASAFNAIGPINSEALQVVSGFINATGNQAYSGTLSHAEADIGAILRIKNPF